MKYLILGLVVASAAQSTQTFTGTITDSVCDRGDHSHMQMGPTDADCVMACVDAHGAPFVLWDGKEVYALSDQRTPERFAAQKVSVVGTVDPKTRTIQVDSIRAAE